MLLSDKDILKLIEDGKIKIKPFHKDALGPASYDMRLGRKALGSKTGIIENIEEIGVVTIKPHEFLEFLTFEEIELPLDIAAIIGLKFSVARRGLIPITGPIVDPGFKGKLMFAVYNPLPIEIRLGFYERVLKIAFIKLTTPASKPYSGKYQNQKDIPKDDIQYFYNIWKAYAERY